VFELFACHPLDMSFRWAEKAVVVVSGEYMQREAEAEVQTPAVAE